MELGYHGEGRELLAASLDVAPPEASPELMEVLAELAMLELWNGEPRLASSFADRVRATAGALGDPDAVARASRLEATLAWGRGDYRLAAAEQVAALEHLTEVDPTAAAYVTGGAAFLALVTGDDDVAGRLIADLEDAADELDRPELNALRHEMRAWNAFQSGDSKKALESWLTAVDGYASLDLRANLADVLLLACWAATAVEDLDTARRCAGQALDHARALPSQFFVARALAALGWCDVFSGNGESGARLVQKALGETRRTGDRYWLLWNTWQAVRLAARHGDFERAATLVGAAKRLAADVGTVAPEPCRVTISSVGLEARDSLGRSRWQRRQRLGRELGDPELIELLDGYVSTLSAGTYSVDA
jgi:ATP/maltotriose-dependent transcriptional regulator MalT